MTRYTEEDQCPDMSGVVSLPSGGVETRPDTRGVAVRRASASGCGWGDEAES
jgi:hypothetical protein